MTTSKIMQKLKKQHAKQVRKMTPGARNNTKVVVRTPTVKAPTNLNRAVTKMKATQAKLKANKNAKVVKMINKK